MKGLTSGEKTNSCLIAKKRSAVLTPFVLKFLTRITSMPKIKLEKLKHPNSRKTKALAKQMKKQSKREKSKLSNNIKLNLLGEKITWFKDRQESKLETPSPRQVEELISQYLGRFDDELEQIKLKHAISNKRSTQHASRKDIINLTIKREKEEYETCGIEIPDFLDPTQYELIKSWNGELRFLQNFKLRRYNKQKLDEEDKKWSKKHTQCTATPEASTVDSEKKISVENENQVSSSSNNVNSTSNNAIMDTDS